MATHAQAISHGHIAHVNWDDLTASAQQDAADALALVTQHETAVNTANTEYTTAMTSDESELIKQNRCQLLHEQEIAIFARCTFHVLEAFTDGQYGPTAWLSYERFVSEYHWCFETMHLDHVFEGECHVGAVPEPPAPHVNMHLAPTTDLDQPMGHGALDEHGCAWDQKWIEQSIHKFCAMMPEHITNPTKEQQNYCMPGLQVWIEGSEDAPGYCMDSIVPPAKDEHGCEPGQVWEESAATVGYCKWPLVTSPEEEHGCTPDQFWNAAENICQFMNPDAAHGCTSNQFWNYGTNACEDFSPAPNHGCEPDQFWNTAENKCQNNDPVKTNPCEPDQFWNSAENKCEHLNPDQGHGCTPDQFWNTAENKCQFLNPDMAHGCTSDQFWNTAENKCQFLNPDQNTCGPGQYWDNPEGICKWLPGGAHDPAPAIPLEQLHDCQAGEIYDTQAVPPHCRFPDAQTPEQVHGCQEGQVWKEAVAATEDSGAIAAHCAWPGPPESAKTPEQEHDCMAGYVWKEAVAATEDSGAIAGHCASLADSADTVSTKEDETPAATTNTAVEAKPALTPEQEHGCVEHQVWMADAAYPYCAWVPRTDGDEHGCTDEQEWDGNYCQWAE